MTVVLMTDTTTMAVAVAASAGPGDGALIKNDRMGRMRFTREQREKILDAYEASGASGKDFAEIHGTKYQTLAIWVQRRRRKHGLMQSAVDGTASNPALCLAEIELGGESAGASIIPLVLSLPGGTEMTLCPMSPDPVAAALLQSLSGQSHAELQR